MPLAPYFLVYSNPNPSSSHRAGTDILISRCFASSFNVSDEIVVLGFIQRLTLTPGPTSPFLSSVTLINVYLPCGSGTGPSAERAEALAKLTALIIPRQPSSPHRWRLDDLDDGKRPNSMEDRWDKQVSTDLLSGEVCYFF